MAVDLVKDADAHTGDAPPPPVRKATLADRDNTLAWIFLITPHLADPSLSPLQRLLSVAYPVGDVLILATIGRLIVLHRFSPAVLLMSIGDSGNPGGRAQE